MNILFITPWSPDDRTCGGGVRSGLMLRALSELGNVVTVVGGAPRGIRFQIKWFLMLPFMCFPKLMDRFYFTKKQILKQFGLDGKEFDITVVRYVRTMNANAAWKIAPCFLDVDDLPSQAFNTLSIHTHCLFKRKVVVGLLRIWESLLIRRSTGFWVCNYSQIPLLEKHGNCEYLPNVADPPVDGFRYEHVGQFQFLTVGGMSYSANREGVDWFVENVWPRIVFLHPDAIYNIVGGGTPEHLLKKWGNIQGVRLWGFVDNLSKRYEEADIVIAPIFAGAGTCIKVREAALHGRKTLATPFGARGLNDENRRALGVDVCSTADEFVAAVERFQALSNEDRKQLQVSIAREARLRVSYERFAESVRSLVCKVLMRTCDGR